MNQLDQENNEFLTQLQEENKEAVDRLYKELEQCKVEHSILIKQCNQQKKLLKEETEQVLQTEIDLRTLEKQTTELEQESQKLQLTLEALELQSSDLEKKSSSLLSPSSSFQSSSRKTTILFDTFPLLLEEQEQRAEYYLLKKCSSLHSSPVPIKCGSLTRMHIWCGHEDGWISIWHMQNGQHLESRKLHNNSVLVIRTIEQVIWSLSIDQACIFNDAESKISKKLKPVRVINLGKTHPMTSLQLVIARTNLMSLQKFSSSPFFMFRILKKIRN